MLLRSHLLADTMGFCTLADVLIVPKHRKYSGEVGQGSISNDSEIVAQLDYSQTNTTEIESGVNLECTNCPFAINSNSQSGEDYKWQSYGVQSYIEIDFVTPNGALSLNGNRFLDSQMKDLHLDQFIPRLPFFLKRSQTHTKVVSQSRTTSELYKSERFSWKTAVLSSTTQSIWTY